MHPIPIITMFSGLMLIAGKDNIVMMMMEEKGNEHAKMVSASSTSNDFGLSFSSPLIKLMCAKGQKLQELCGKTMANRIRAGERPGIK